MDCPLELIADRWTCPQCDWVYPLQAERPPRRNCSNSPDLAEAAERLRIFPVDVPYFAQALARWTRAGFPVRGAGDIEFIANELCGPCEFNRGDRCQKCAGCKNKKRLPLAKKIRMETEGCPEWKW